MKTKMKVVCIAIVAMLAVNFDAKAQFPLVNNLNCDVYINWEMWDAAGPCNTCGGGQWVKVPANNSITIPNCATGVSDICIVIMDIGGTTPSLNHATFNGCHILPSGNYGQSGSGIPANCKLGGLWIASHTTSGWSIN